MIPNQKSPPPVEPHSSTRNYIANIQLRDLNNAAVGKVPSSMIPKKTSAKVSTSKAVNVPASQAAGSKRKQNLMEVATDSEIDKVQPLPKKSKKKCQHFILLPDILMLTLIHSQESALTEEMDNEGFLKDLTGLDEIGNLPADGKTMVSTTFLTSPARTSRAMLGGSASSARK